MNCEKYKAQIEELVGGQVLTAEITRHLEHCANCRQHSRECQKLRAMLDCLPTVNAPNDFNFHLKAKLKRQEEPVSVWTWQRLVGGATVTLAALTVGFVVLNSSSSSTQTAFVSDNASQIVASQPQPTATVSVPLNNTVVEPTSAAPPVQAIAVKETVKPRSIEPQRASFRPIQRKVQKQSLNEEILVKDSSTGGVSERALTPATQVMPKGIPNPLAEPKKQDAREILRTLGVETEANGDSLRVTKSNRVDLQSNDVIEKVNGENPAAVTGGKLEEIKLTVRRKDQTKEVTILAKP
jgi:hypothetical protein